MDAINEYDLVVEETWTATVTTKVRAMSMRFDNMPVYQDGSGLATNPCWPQILNDPPNVEKGFALYRGDAFYVVDQGRYGNIQYAQNFVPAEYTQGKTMPTKRSLVYLADEGLMVLDEGNSSRAISPEELEDEEVDEVRVALEKFTAVQLDEASKKAPALNDALTTAVAVQMTATLAIATSAPVFDASQVTEGLSEPSYGAYRHLARHKRVGS